jgi:F0F1-type ATP synthase membrane subunit b/b'
MQMDDIDSAKENIQYQSDRVEELKTQLNEAEEEKQTAIESLKEAAESVANEYQS